MNDRVLSSYVSTVSRLSGCLQFMETSERQEDEDDSDEDDMKANLYKAAEQDVIIPYTPPHNPSISLNVILFK